jgi:ADP-heptose:LPS heptosyltransferase
VISVARANAAAILAASGLPDQVLVRDSYKGARGFLRLVSSLRAAHPDASLALSPSAGTSLLARLSGASRRLGYSQADLSWLSEAIPFRGGGVENYLSLLPPLGLLRTVSSYVGLLRVGAAERREADELLASVRIAPADPFVAISPISTGKLDVKAYPEESWCAVCGTLQADGYPVVLVGSAADVPAHARMARLAGKEIASLAGKTSPVVLAGVLQRAGCVAGVDTGPIHVAAAVGAPCVVIFGPSNPERTAPCGEGHIVLSRGLDCQPCLDGPCKRQGACLRMVTPEEVVAAVESVLRAGRGQGTAGANPSLG